jgi:fructose-bisphosphate aldolase class II
VRYVVEACHAAKVPIAVHVDHAGTDEDICRVLDFADQGAAVDSIMIDCSHHDTDEDNIAMAKPYCERAAKLGMVVEVELGRLAGGEEGVRTIDEGALTKPSKGEN